VTAEEQNSGCQWRIAPEELTDAVYHTDWQRITALQHEQTFIVCQSKDALAKVSTQYSHIIIFFTGIVIKSLVLNKCPHN
jgi:hypothetical protein